MMLRILGPVLFNMLFLEFMLCIIVIIIISNSNWTSCRTIQGVIARVISKSDEREAQGRFENTSTIMIPELY